MTRKIEILVIGLLWAGWIGAGSAVAVECDCSIDATDRRGGTAWIEDFGDDPPEWTARMEEEYRRSGRPEGEFFVRKQGSHEVSSWIDPSEIRSGGQRADDLLRITVDRADEYADRDPLFNDSDPYIRFYVGPPSGGWVYVGPSEVVEGCDGEDCDAVFDTTVDVPIDRDGLWDVSPEVWDDDGGWSDDEVLGYGDFLDIPPAGLSMAWRFLDQDGDYQCWERFSVEYVDGGVDDPTWNSYPTGTVAAGTFDWDNPADRSMVVGGELHLSSDAVFDGSDEYVYPVTGSVYAFDCAVSPPAEGLYHFAVRVQDGAGHWSGYVSPGTTFTVSCATPTNTPEPLPTFTPVPAVVPTAGPAGLILRGMALGALLLSRRR